MRAALFLVAAGRFFQVAPPRAPRVGTRAGLLGAAAPAAPAFGPALKGSSRSAAPGPAQVL